MHATALQPAYILHTRRFSESSLLVEFLTRDDGRVATLAKGALSGKSGRQSLLQPFVPLLIAWRGRGELPTLTQLEAAGQATMPQGKALYCGLYINELVLHFTHRQDAHTSLFVHYAACLLALFKTGGSNAQIEPVLRQFELDLLHELGIGLTLTEDQNNQPIQTDAHYVYDMADGLCLSTPGSHTVMGAALLALAKRQFTNKEQRIQARQFMRHVLDHRLGGKPLKSRELFL